jgi:hypothetical protein
MNLKQVVKGDNVVELSCIMKGVLLESDGALVASGPVGSVPAGKVVHEDDWNRTRRYCIDDKVTAGVLLGFMS